MTGLDGIMARLLFKLALLMTVLVVVATLSAIGLIWLVDALTLSLAPLIGVAGAHAVAGVAALMPLLLLFVVLYRLALRDHRRALGDGLRDSIRSNPWESLGMAFFLGFTQHGRHPERTHVLMELIRGRKAGNEHSDASSEKTQGVASPE